MKPLVFLRALAIVGLVTSLCPLLPTNALQQADLTQVQSALDQGNGDTALALLEPILKKSSKDPDALLARSTAHFLRDDLEAGARDLERALKLDSTLRQGWLNLGALRLSEGDGEAALDAFFKARELDPTATENALNIGAVQLLLGRVDKARQEFGSYLLTVGNTAEANALIAKNYALANVLADATDHAEAAIVADERQRVAMRTDPAFSLALDHPPFQALLARDQFNPPTGSLTTTHTLETPYETNLIAGALIDALNTLRIPFDPRVEATHQWALIWADQLRIKVAPATAATTLITIVAPPRSHTRASWQSLQDRLFNQVAYELAPKIPQVRR